MAQSNSIKTILYGTIHRNKKSVEQIADEIGISANYLYRAGLPLDESGVKFPVDYLVPLMKTTKNYRIIEHIAFLCGFLLVREPRVGSKGTDKTELVSDYQEITIEAVRCLKKFLDKPTQSNYDEVIQALQTVMTKSAEAKKYCNKQYQGQLELEL
ncbi:phage regulatory CII family protein [Ignavibacterium sp.]|uniref:phage regulatory CII family protein n=1 Tax=Ignavibacterium sp. TaxID=2651167 RepID=UPI00307E3205